MPPGYESFAPIIAGIFPSTDNLEWSVGINLSFPIFDQYQRFSDKSIAKSEISKIYLEKQSIMSKLEQRIRTMIQKASISYPAIKLSKDASISAHKGLDVVEDAYSKGMVSIIELIDIQNNTLIAEKIVADSVYEFSIDLMNVKRSIGIKLYDNKSTDKILADFLKKN
jgi:outer membrane protein TolC